MSNIVFSCVIPVSSKDSDSQKLKDLISSIREQDFPQDQIEILTVTEGDSESAKAIGIRRARGEICAMFCADNYLVNKHTFTAIVCIFSEVGNENLTGIYCKHYYYEKKDKSLNRYFSLMGCNDILAFYLNKADRKPIYHLTPWKLPYIYRKEKFRESIPSLGDNGFFVRKSHIIRSNLRHYYPMDSFEDLRKLGLNEYAVIQTPYSYLWHRTSHSLISFLKRRYCYARDLYSDRNDRRWKMLDTRKDFLRLGLFLVSTITIIPCLIVSMRGFFKIRDWAWFLHPIVCWGFLITYSILAIRNLLKHGNFFQVKCPLPA